MGFLLLIAGPPIFTLPNLLRWPSENYDAFFDLPAPRRYAYACVQYLLYVRDGFTTASFSELRPTNVVARLLPAVPGSSASSSRDCWDSSPATGYGDRGARVEPASGASGQPAMIGGVTVVRPKDAH